MINNNNAKFVKSSDYKRIAINGVWGGVNSLGEVKLDLFEDVASLPKKVDLSTNQATEDSEIPIERIAHVGVTIPIAVLPDIANYLLALYEQYNNHPNSVKN